MFGRSLQLDLVAVGILDINGRPVPVGAETPSGFHDLHAVFRQVTVTAHELVEHQYALWNDSLLPQLAAEGIEFHRRHVWNDEQRAWIKSYFMREIMPVMTPIGLDPAHPFPRILNKSLNFAVQLSGKDAFGRNSGIALVQAPRI